MPSVSTPLQKLRKGASLTLEEAARRIRDVEPSAPKTEVGLWHIEQNGTDRLRIIDAMAKVYGVDREVVEAAAYLQKM